jgi:hypothetical protein
MNEIRTFITKSIPLLTTGIGLFLANCRFDKESEKYPLLPCDTVAVSYSQKVVPILSEYCYTCHAAAVAQTAGAGIVLDSYTELTNFLNTFENIFRESITHTGSASPMPKGSQKLDACAINTLLAWIRQGKPDN